MAGMEVGSGQFAIGPNTGRTDIDPLNDWPSSRHQLHRVHPNSLPAYNNVGDAGVEQYRAGVATVAECQCRAAMTTLAPRLAKSSAARRPMCICIPLA